MRSDSRCFLHRSTGDSCEMPPSRGSSRVRSLGNLKLLLPTFADRLQMMLNTLTAVVRWLRLLLSTRFGRSENASQSFACQSLLSERYIGVNGLRSKLTPVSYHQVDLEPLYTQIRKAHRIFRICSSGASNEYQGFDCRQIYSVHDLVHYLA